LEHSALYTADAYRKDGKRFTVLADDKLSVFLGLERATPLGLERF
jgi:hypothetical protein